MERRGNVSVCRGQKRKLFIGQEENGEERKENKSLYADVRKTKDHEKEEEDESSVEKGEGRAYQKCKSDERGSAVRKKGNGV